MSAIWFRPQCDNEKPNEEEMMLWKYLHYLQLNLAPERCEINFTSVFFKPILQINIFSTSCKIGLKWVPQDYFEWFGAIRPQAITWSHVNSDFSHHMVSLGHNESAPIFSVLFWGALFPAYTAYLIMTKGSSGETQYWKLTPSNQGYCLHTQLTSLWLRSLVVRHSTESWHQVIKAIACIHNLPHYD